MMAVTIEHTQVVMINKMVAFEVGIRGSLPVTEAMYSGHTLKRTIMVAPRINICHGRKGIVPTPTNKNSTKYVGESCTVSLRMSSVKLTRPPAKMRREKTSRAV
jgi:hypothetical protein